MEDMQYAAEKDILLTDISSCITEAGYKTSLDNHHIMGNVLHVYYDVKSSVENIELYCRWSLQENGIYSLEAEQTAKFLYQNSKLKTVFHIQYRVFGIETLSKILETVLKCYDGNIYYEGNFFDKNSILKIRDYSRK